MKIVILGGLLHIIFLLSVFDIYFKSPIIHNIPVQQNNIHSPARRLVLFVADGLRADSLFTVSNNGSDSSYVRSVIESRGVWGVAHSRVPTESRPGHIALIAGFYEDPSAVFTGWKDNLVEFDSVFNRSFLTYSWGSPDILPMFKKGAVENKVHTFSYDAEDEDFSGYGSTKLNTWVFNKVEKFINSAKQDVPLKKLLNHDGVVFFLHLLGPDVAGHASKPHSRDYKLNIRVVDEGVKRIEELLNEFYEDDNKTVFIYTSDHGMTDWGSHGAGSTSETEVPLVVWGAGTSAPVTLNTPDPRTPVRWNLHYLQRTDVAQADVAPLMAVLIGVPIPVHSVGVLPLEYLSVSNKDKVAAMELNARQLAAQYGRKRDTVESNMIHYLYKPFPELPRGREEVILGNITQLTGEGKYYEAIEESRHLIQLSQAGLDYYHSYFQGLLLFSISLSFLGWITWLFCQLLEQTQDSVSPEDNHFRIKNFKVWPDVTFVVAIATSSYIIYVQSLPVQFHFYCCLPLQLWWAVVRQSQTICYLFLKNHPLELLLSAALYLVLLELLVLTFYKRWVLSLVVAVVGFWPFSLGKRRSLLPSGVQICWLLSFLLLAMFPALPVIGSQTEVQFVVLCGGLWILLGLASLYLLGLSQTGWTVPSQLVMVSLATAVIFFTTRDFENELGLQVLNQAGAWALLVTSLIVPLLTDNKIVVRFLSIGLGCVVPFLLLCVGHESFFLLCLFFNLCTWLVAEAHLSEVKVSKIEFKETMGMGHMLSPDDFRKCFFFLVYVILSFFGTGNIASLNSFDVSWVRCFLTVFSPFTMMTLILLKTVIPFFLVTCAFRAVNVFSQVKVEKMFIIVLIYCDIMGLHFLYAVTNKGSWLEIGTSVSHFVIMEATVLFLAALYFVARLYTTGTVFTKESSSQPITPIWLTFNKNHPD